MPLLNGDSFVQYKINGQAPPWGLMLIDFEIEFEEGVLSQACFTFSNEAQQLSDKKLGAIILPGNKITFSWGWINQASKPLTYVIKRHKGFKQVKVYAYPDIQNFDKPYQRTFKNYKYSESATTMAGEMGLKPEVQATDCKEKSLQQTNETNPKFLKRAADELHFALSFDDGKLLFKPRDYAQKSLHNLYYQMQQINGAILDFDPDKNVFEIPTAWKELFIDPKTGKMEEIKVTDSDVKRDLIGGQHSFIAGAMGGSSQPSQVKVGNPKVKLSRETGATTPVSSAKQSIEYPKPAGRTRKDQAKCLADDHFKKAEDSMIKAKVKFLGMPKMKALEVCTLFGLGPFFSGAWYIRKIRHNIGRNGYRCEAEILRNALPKKTENTGASTKGKDKQPPVKAMRPIDNAKPVANTQEKLTR